MAKRLRLPQSEAINAVLLLGGEKIPLCLDVLKTAEIMAEGFVQLDAALGQGDRELAGVVFAAMAEKMLGAELAVRIYDYYQNRSDELELYFIPFVMKTLFGLVEKGLRRVERRRLRAYR